MKYIKGFWLKVVLAIALTFTASIFTQSAFADNGGANFSVSPVQTSSKSYFDLNLRSGQTSKIKITISNDSNESNIFEVFANNAITNSNMLIDYSPTKHQSRYLYNRDFDFQKMVSPKKTKVTINPHSTKQVEFDLRMPDQDFNNEVLGGVYVRRVPKKMVKNGYTNRFNFAIPILIHINHQHVSPALKLKKVSMKISEFNNQIQVHMQNSAMTYTNNLSVHTSIYNKQNHRVLNVKNNQSSIAPNSKFSYMLPLNKHLKSGKYMLKMDIVNDKTGKTWHFEKGFEVTQKEAITSSDSYKMMTSMPVWVYLLAGLFLLIIILLLVLIFRRKKNN